MDGAGADPDVHVGAVAGLQHEDPGARAPGEAPRLPPRALWLLVVPALVGVSGVLGNALMPALVNDEPLLLLALNSRPRNLILTVSAPLGPWLAIGVFRAFVTDPFMYVLGRDYGSIAVAWMEHRAGVLARGYRWLERLYARGATWLVLLAPWPSVCLLAGASGMSWQRFLLLNLSGTVGSILLYRFFGQQFTETIELVLGFVARHKWTLTAISSTLVALGLAVRGLRLARARQRAAQAED